MHGFTKDYPQPYAGGGLQVLVNGTPTATTSGTSVDLTGIPSGVSRIKINMDQVSTNGTSTKLIQLGTGGTPQTSSYISASSFIAGSVGTATSTSGFLIYSGGAGDFLSGSITLTLMDPATNTWAMSGVLVNNTGTSTHLVGGTVALSNALDIIRLTTSGGTNAFDNGVVQIQYDNTDLVGAETVYLEGGCLQCVHYSDGEVFTGTTALPMDNTVPQSGEGNEWGTISITPKRDDSTLLVLVHLDISNNTSSANVGAALFLDSETSARAGRFLTNVNAGTSGFNTQLSFAYKMTAGQTTSMTFKVRIGSTTSTTVINGWNSGRIWGGVSSSTITVLEIAP